MNTSQQAKIIAQVPAALASLLAIEEADLTVSASGETDLIVEVIGHTFVIDVLASASPGALSSRTGTAIASRLLSAAVPMRRKVVPIVAVPFMTEAGRGVCEGTSTSWFDLSGNAHIVAPGLRVIVEGKPNLFRGPGRPASIFAPKSARVVRWLLANEGHALTQREIARATNMTEGFVSRIASRLVHENYVVRTASGALKVKNPQLLLDAWRDEYLFEKHQILRGNVAARNGDALTRFVSDTLVESTVEHAATGLSAAWQMTHFAAFRIASFFVAEHPSKELLAKLGFREGARGANLWLIVPNDAGVFDGAEPRDGVRCVHPVQTYVDLKAHPERAAEAAEELRDAMFGGRDGQ